MGIQVPSPPLSAKVPLSLAKTDEEKRYWRNVNDFLLRLWKRSGGGDDLLDDAEQALTSTGSRVSRNAARINAIEKTDFTIEIITEDFTTERNQIIICRNTSSINVTLDTQALEEDTVHIKRTDAVVKVIGTVDGKVNKTINIKYFSMHLVFNGTDWSQI